MMQNIELHLQKTSLSTPVKVRPKSVFPISRNRALRTISPVSGIQKNAPAAKQAQCKDIFCLSSDLWLLITLHLTFQDILRLERTCKDITLLLSGNSQSVWLEKCRAEGISNGKHDQELQEERPIRKIDRYQERRHFLSYMQTKSLWMLGNYSMNDRCCTVTSSTNSSALSSDGGGLKGVPFIASLGDSNQLLTACWTGQISLWKLELLEVPARNHHLCQQEDKLSWIDELEDDEKEGNLWKIITPPPTPSEPSVVFATGLSHSKLLAQADGGFLKCIAASQETGVLAACFTYASKSVIKILNSSRQNLTCSIDIPEPAASLAISRSGKVCAAVIGDAVYQWKVDDTLSNRISELKDALIIQDKVSLKYVAWLQDDEHLLTMGIGGSFSVWNLRTASRLLHVISVSGLSSGHISSSSATNGYEVTWRIVGGYKDSNLRSWILTYNTLLGTYKVSPMLLLCSLGDHVTCIRTYENLILTGSWDGKIRIFDVSRPSSLRRTLQCHQKGGGGSSPIMSLDFLGYRIVSGHYNGRLKVWNFSDGKVSSSSSMGEGKEDDSKKRVKLGG